MARKGPALILAGGLLLSLTGVLFAGEPSALPKGIADLEIGALWYLSYQNGQSGGQDYGKFVVKRGYINVKKKLAPWLEARITPDAHQDSEGDMKVRLKYAYADFKIPSEGFLYKPWIEFGLVHMPWLDFEEHINYYRCQDTMFAERNGNFNSADFGFTFGSLFGGEMSEAYQKKVNNKYPGRYGSFAAGVYNGGGYHASEENENKVLEGRVTVRPAPDRIPGLQFSYFGVYGKGNVARTDETAPPDWRFNMFMASYEHEFLTVTGSYLRSRGNQKGSLVDSEGNAYEQGGCSLFAELKIPARHSSVIARWDRYNPNKDADNNANNRFIAGYAYHLPGHSMLVADYERLTYDDALMKNDDWRFQATIQIHYP